MILTNAIYKLQPYISEKIWGYERWLVSTLNRQESSSKENGQIVNTSTITNGAYPLLIKLIQANDTLSVQVHPDDNYAEKNEHSFGKTECWYILDATPGATLISGIRGEYNRETFAHAIQTNTLEEHLYQTPVSKGDFIFIPAGTVHAIQGGLRILEIQQPSDVTYRLYDWGRGRELHIEKSLDVIKSIVSEPVKHFSGAFSCDYFTVEKIEVNGEYPIAAESGNCTAFFVLSGSGTFRVGEQTMPVTAEDTVLVKADTPITVSGTLELFKMHP